MPASTVKKVVDSVFLDVIFVALETGENVVITNFGGFAVKNQSERMWRNPQTGKNVVILARQKVCFKPSKNMRYQNADTKRTKGARIE